MERQEGRLGGLGMNSLVVDDRCKWSLKSSS